MTRPSSPDQAVLDDLLVLELGDEGTQYCGSLLADMGARVIKIEPPGGAGCRHRGPFKDDQPDVNGSLYFWAYNVNKESVTLDLNAEADRRKVKRLAQKADIILEDFKPGYLDSLGLGYHQLSKLNPRVIMTSVTPFGQTGPLKDWKGADLVYWAMGGILTGGYYDDPPTPPLGPQGEFAFTVAGHWALVGTMIALTARDVAGEGQQVDLSIHEACSYVNRGAVTQTGSMFNARNATRRGSFGEGKIRCGDGKYFLPQMSGANMRPDQWTELTEWFKQEGVGKEMWGVELQTVRSRFPAAPGGGMRGLPPIVYEALEEAAAKHRLEEMWPLGQKMGFTWMAFNAPDELLEDEQLQYRGFFQQVYHPEHNVSYTYAGEPYKFSEAGWRIRRRPPLLGEDNAKLAELLP